MYMKKAIQFIKASAKDKLYMVGEYIFYQRFFYNWKKNYNYNGKFKFINRRKESSKLLIVVIGYKRFLWEKILNRITKYTPEEFDVCLCIPGRLIKENEELLYSYAEKNRWSIVQTNENKLSLAQNHAIRIHPKANYIYKLDEDIFIGKGYFINIAQTYDQVLKDGYYKPMMVVPTLNVNGHTYLHVLKHFSALERYKQKFRFLISSCTEIPIHYDPEAALFMWTLGNFDKTVEEYTSYYQSAYHPCPHRFSIGAFMMTRDVFDMFGGFSVAPSGVLGTEEEYLAVLAAKNSMPIIVSENTFAGHFSFGLQEQFMKEHIKSINI